MNNQVFHESDARVFTVGILRETSHASVFRKLSFVRRSWARFEVNYPTRTFQYRTKIPDYPGIKGEHLRVQNKVSQPQLVPYQYEFIT